jgi:hypothetical protein
MHRLAFVVWVTVVVGCGSSSTAPPAPGPNIEFVTGNHQTDTILSTLPAILKVKVNNAPHGKFAALQPILFESLSNGPQAAIKNVGSPYGFVAVLQDTTNGLAEASLQVALGPTAGVARILVTVPAFGFVDTATFTVTPGHPFAISTSPSDTLIYIGTPLTMRSTVVDQGNNVLNDAVSYSIDSGSATVSGSVITPTALGTVSVVASSGRAFDRTSIAAVPHGRLAAVGGQGLQFYSLDGSGASTFPPGLSPFYSSDLKWAPSGTLLVFDQGFVEGALCNSGSLPGVYTTDFNGAIKTVDAGAPGDCDWFASYSRDGSWVYFSRVEGNASTLWRARADGSETDSLPVTPLALWSQYPSASPDGSQLAFSASGQPSGPYDLQVVSMAAGTARSLGVVGFSATWSPTANQIAYITGGGFTGPIAIINSDGTGNRTLAAGPYDYDMDWSPDGRYLVARNDSSGYLDLIDVTTSVRLSLPYSGSLKWPTWLPTVPTGVSTQRSISRRPRVSVAGH